MSAATREKFDGTQHPIRLPVTFGPDGSISGPRHLVAPMSRVGGQCSERRCELNVHGKCGAWTRRVCPEVTP